MARSKGGDGDDCSSEMPRTGRRKGGIFCVKNGKKLVPRDGLSWFDLKPKKIQHIK